MIHHLADETQLERLRAIMHRLRAPEGCPWDAEQTHDSIVPNLIEEAYEVIDAIKRQDMSHLREELGDLLLQVVFHAELAEEAGFFNFNDVAREVSEKLVRRHPHVFGQAGVKNSDEVLKQWDLIKTQEKPLKESSYLTGTGKGLPAWLRAIKLQKKASKVGFDWPDVSGVLGKIKEEIVELEEAVRSEKRDDIEEELGDALFSLINLARVYRIDPELLMDAANQKFEKRFSAMEKCLLAKGMALETTDLDEMEKVWQEVKRSEKG